MVQFEEAKEMLDYDRAIQGRLNQLCEPLSLLGISNFSYVKISKENKFLRISNFSPYTDLYFENEFYNHPGSRLGFSKDLPENQEKLTVMHLWDMGNQGPAGPLRQSVNMWNGATVYVTQHDCLEAFAFGGTLEGTSLSNLYINNTPLLKRFITYFKTEARDLIRESATISIKQPVALTHAEPIDQSILAEFVNRIAGNRYLLKNASGDFTLTPREIQCLLYKDQGLSAKEMARNMGISYRTVESYIENIKTKSGLGGINQVLAICRDEGLI